MLAAVRSMRSSGTRLSPILTVTTSTPAARYRESWGRYSSMSARGRQAWLSQTSPASFMMTASHLAEAPALEVGERRRDLALAVHDEGTVAHDRLGDRLAREDQCRELALGLHGEFTALARKPHELRRPGRMRAIDEGASLHRDDRRGVALRSPERDGLAVGDSQVPDLDRRERLRRAAVAF